MFSDFTARFLWICLATLVWVGPLHAQKSPEDEAPRAVQRHEPSGTSGCRLEPGGESTVLAIAGPQTLRLADGRILKLSEVLVPSIPGAGFDPSAAATDYLRKAVLGRRIEVKFGGTQRDRYGVYAGHV